jgi:hypothetical protein
LLIKGANPNVVGYSGNTPLHYAVEGLNVGAVSVLLMANANPETLNAKSKTPLQCIEGMKKNPKYAAYKEHIEQIISLLTTACYDAEAEALRDEYPLYFAAKIGFDERLASVITMESARTEIKDFRHAFDLAFAASQFYQARLASKDELAEFMLADMDPVGKDSAKVIDKLPSYNALHDRLEGCYMVQERLRIFMEPRVGKLPRPELASVLAKLVDRPDGGECSMTSTAKKDLADTSSGCVAIGISVVSASP